MPCNRKYDGSKIREKDQKKLSCDNDQNGHPGQHHAAFTRDDDKAYEITWDAGIKGKNEEAD